VGGKQDTSRTSRQGKSLAKPPPPARESTGRAGTNQEELQPARESTGQDQEGEALEDEDELMARRGRLRPHSDDEEEQDGPTEVKRVFNRRKRREHDDEREEPLLKRIKHVMERGMRAEATKARKRFKQVVTALSVMSYDARQKDFCKCFSAMTDQQLLAALKTGELEFSSGGAQAPSHQPIQHAPSQPAPQPASQFPVTHERNQEAQQPSRQKKEAGPLQAGRADRHLGWGRQQRAREETDSQAQPGTSSQKQPRGEQPAEGAPQAQQPEAEPIQPAKKSKSVRKFLAKQARRAAEAAKSTFCSGGE
jgi:hypothetical protein